MSKITKEQLETIVTQKRKSDELIINLGMLEAKKHELLHTFAQISGELEDTKKDLEMKLNPKEAQILTQSKASKNFSEGVQNSLKS